MYCLFALVGLLRNIACYHRLSNSAFIVPFAACASSLAVKAIRWGREF